jgi:hypothetical protein
MNQRRISLERRPNEQTKRATETDIKPQYGCPSTINRFAERDDAKGRTLISFPKGGAVNT